MKPSFLFLTLAALVSTVTATPLEEDSTQRIFSPNWDFVAATEHGQRGGSRLLIAASKEAKLPQQTWLSRKYMSLLWSPDSRWLAVIDHYLAGQSAVLVFDVTQAGFPLVYQTPADTKSATWEIEAWDCPKMQVRLKGDNTSSSEPQIETITLTHKPIKQSLYPKGSLP